jgi:hypothetical protein
MENCRDFDGVVPFQQSEVYALAARAMGARADWHDLGCARALVVERGRLRSVFRGPIWHPGADPQDCRRALRRLARWPGVTLATPEVPLHGLGLLPLVTPLHHAIWDLTGDLRQGMAGKWRNRLVAAEARVTPSPGGAGTLDRLIRAEAAQRKARGYRSLSEGFTRALPPAALRLWEWRTHGRMGAAMAFVLHGKGATYHLGWTSEAGRAVGAHGVMLARAAEALAAEGVRWLDLGAVDSEAAPGLARFKLGTGACLRQLGATLLVLP